MIRKILLGAWLCIVTWLVADNVIANQALLQLNAPFNVEIEAGNKRRGTGRYKEFFLPVKAGDQLSFQIQGQAGVRIKSAVYLYETQSNNTDKFSPVDENLNWTSEPLTACKLRIWIVAYPPYGTLTVLVSLNNAANPQPNANLNAPPQMQPKPAVPKEAPAVANALAAKEKSMGKKSPSEPAADKYALLIAVQDYAHPEISDLNFPEIDAQAFHDVLSDSGYQVDLLMGRQASQQAIRRALQQLQSRGSNKGVVFIGVFGHGIEFSDVKKSYYCPYDSTMTSRRDADGQVLFNKAGGSLLEPDRKSLIAIDELLVALRESQATNRVLIADCCRDDPNQSRTFGSSLETNQLPTNAAVFFACSANQRAYEDKAWGHGAFTKCLLEQLRNGRSLMGSLAEEVAPAVEQLVETKRQKGEPPQTPRLLTTGARIDLQLRVENESER